MASLDLQMKQIARRVTMHVKMHGVKQWQWRVKVGIWLIRLAAWVMWVNVEVED